MSTNKKPIAEERIVSVNETSIAPERLYAARDLFQSLGWRDAIQRKARRLGLEVRYFGGRKYLLGSDVIKFVMTHGKTSKDGK